MVGEAEGLVGVWEMRRLPVKGPRSGNCKATVRRFFSRGTVHKLSLILLITYSEQATPMAARARMLRVFCRKSTGFELGPLTVRLLPWLLRSAHEEMMHAVVEMGLGGEVLG
ncbi:hypothetical protein RHMOL_Rhmol05G0058500 [Rhododendron molle]|uniref:Uncharacterized protein n=1 Tax=Rhododendron molle TaxID=49168 RepID=A0ACC0NL66_RHOML|nr:hypothetical protein RHMOL_Rhmol05G0058500 [Rhododendron molle]